MHTALFILVTSTLLLGIYIGILIERHRLEERYRFVAELIVAAELEAQASRQGPQVVMQQVREGAHGRLNTIVEELAQKQQDTTVSPAAFVRRAAGTVLLLALVLGFAGGLRAQVGAIQDSESKAGQAQAGVIDQAPMVMRRLGVAITN
jgi:hypothetical protein